jgi:hypothetical protein
VLDGGRFGRLPADADFAGAICGLLAMPANAA